MTRRPGLVLLARFANMSVRLMPHSSKIISNTILALIMVMGGWLRFTGLDWDSRYQLHPDERAILFVEQRIDAPTSLPQALDARVSPANPFNAPQGAPPYPYGHLPLYANVAISRLLELACGSLSLCGSISPDSLAAQLLNVSALPHYDHLLMVGRAMSALCDTITIGVTFWLAKSIGNRVSGLVAASLVAFAVVHIQNAHFGTVDALTTLFSTISLLFMTRPISPHRTALSGLFMGLAVSCKLASALLLAPFVVSELSILRSGSSWRISGIRTFLKGACVAFIAFTFTSPYAILDGAFYTEGAITQAGIASGWLDAPYTRQYIGAIPLAYTLDQQARWALGLPVTLVAYTGVAFSVIEAAKTKRRQLLTQLCWIFVTLIASSVLLAKLPRYMLPATPTLVSMGSRLLTIPFVEPLKRPLKLPCSAAIWSVAIVLITVVFTAGYAIAFANLYTQTHPLVEASHWIYRELPPTSSLAVERWDDALPLPPANDDAPQFREKDFARYSVDWFAEPDGEEKLEGNLHYIAESDYIILSSNRLYGTIPRLRLRYPFSAAYYRTLFSGELGFALVNVFQRFPRILGISLVDDTIAGTGLADPGIAFPEFAIHLGSVDESFTVYDHPQALIFKNTQHYSFARLMSIVLANPQNH